MHQLHHIIHTEAAGHAVIALTVNELTGCGVKPAGTYEGCVGIRVGGLQVGAHTSLAIVSNNPTQRSKFSV